MTKIKTKKKPVKRDNRSSIDILTADCIALAQRLETLSLTAHSQERAARIELDAIVAPFVRKHPWESRERGELDEVHEISGRLSDECDDLARAIREGIFAIRTSVGDLIADGKSDNPADTF